MAEQGTVKWFNGAKGYGFISRQIAKMFCAFLGYGHSKRSRAKR